MAWHYVAHISWINWHQGGTVPKIGKLKRMKSGIQNVNWNISYRNGKYKSWYDLFGRLVCFKLGWIIKQSKRQNKSSFQDLLLFLTRIGDSQRQERIYSTYKRTMLHNYTDNVTKLYKVSQLSDKMFTYKIRQST